MRQHSWAPWPRVPSSPLLLAACSLLAHRAVAGGGHVSPPPGADAEASDSSEEFCPDGAEGMCGRFPPDAVLVFDNSWMRLVTKHGGEDSVNFPKEIIWLNGAPGAGKTTNTDFIRRERSIHSDPVIVSSLLQTPQMIEAKAQGLLVGDKQVTDLVFDELLDPKYRNGVVVDGYPRTLLQAAIVRLLHDRLSVMHRLHKGTDLAYLFLRPIFRIVVLYVDEPTSVARQMKRARQTEAHNARVLETGVGSFLELRDTDKDEGLCVRRYKVFIEITYEALKTFGTLFTFHLINAGGPLEDVRLNIEQEMQYQSSIELNPDTFDTVATLELASEITMNARQRLVLRMDDYAAKHGADFRAVARALKAEVYPVIHMHAISGRCSYVSHSSIFLDDLKLQMAIDILSERGFRVTSEPVVRGTKLDIAWQPPDKLGSTRLVKADEDVMRPSSAARP